MRRGLSVNLSDVDSEVVKIFNFISSHSNRENLVYLTGRKIYFQSIALQIERLIQFGDIAPDMPHPEMPLRKDLLQYIFSIFKPHQTEEIIKHLKEMLYDINNNLIKHILIWEEGCKEYKSLGHEPNIKLADKKIKQIDFLCKKKVALKIFKLLAKYGFINKMSSEQILLHCRCSDTKAVLLSEIQKIEWLKSEKALICLINALVEMRLLHPARKWASFGEHFIHKSGAEFKYLRVMNGNKEYYKDYQDPEITALLNEL